MNLERTEKPSSHTPGPYIYRRGTDGCFDTWNIVTKAENRMIAGVYFWGGDDEESLLVEKEANARLLAAAPELLEALRDLVQECDFLPKAVFDSEFSAVYANASFLINRTRGQV